MGVKDTHTFLQGFSPEVVGSPQLKNLKTIHFNLFGLVLSMIINHFFQKVSSVAEKFILMKLDSIFCMEHAVLYLDSGTTQEKQATANRRRKSKKEIPRIWSLCYMCLR
jgi:hypothetical protein